MAVSRETSLETFPRDTFVNERFRYNTGEHVTVIGPTRSGKSYLVFDLLRKVARPSRPTVYLVKKPRDALIAARGKELDFRRVNQWPPMRYPWQAKPAGYLVWPKTNFTDMEANNLHKWTVFRDAILDSYKHGKRIVIADDAYGLSEILKLRRELVEMWTEAAAMECGLWAMFQRPAYVPPWAYGGSEHLFLFNDPDKRSRERFADIGGVDPQLVQNIVFGLDRHQALYIRRDGPAMCIVDR